MREKERGTNSKIEMEDPTKDILDESPGISSQGNCRECEDKEESKSILRKSNIAMNVRTIQINISV
jgi:hypothetical protein